MECRIPSETLTLPDTTMKEIKKQKLIIFIMTYQDQTLSLMFEDNVEKSRVKGKVFFALKSTNLPTVIFTSLQTRPDFRATQNILTFNLMNLKISQLSLKNKKKKKSYKNKKQ